MKTPLSTVVAALLVGLLAAPAGPAAADEDPREKTIVNLDRGSLGVMLAGGAGHLEADPDGHGRYFVFAEPPRVVRVVRGGPSDGKLAEDDVILDVDGVDVATARGSLLLVRPDPGDEVTLRVRRDGVEKDVTIAVGRYDRSLARDYTFDVVRRDPEGRLRTAETVDLTRSRAEIRELAEQQREIRDELRESARSRQSSFVSRGRRGGVGTTCSWYGFGLETKALIVKKDDEDHSVIYFEDPPRIYNVDPDGPAGLAGLQRGDVLVEIDGEALDQDVGAERFSSAEPGETVWLVYERDGEHGRVELVTEDYPVRVVRRPQPVTELAGGVVVHANHLRYAGSVGDVDVEVRGVGEVSVSKTATEIVIDTGSATIRLKRRD